MKIRVREEERSGLNTEDTEFERKGAVGSSEAQNLFARILVPGGAPGGVPGRGAAPPRAEPRQPVPGARPTAEREGAWRSHSCERMH